MRGEGEGERGGRSSAGEGKKENFSPLDELRTKFLVTI